MTSGARQMFATVRGYHAESLMTCETSLAGGPPVKSWLGAFATHTTAWASYHVDGRGPIVAWNYR